MKTDYFLFPIGLLITLLSCLDKNLYLTIIIIGITFMGLTKKNNNRFICIVLIMGIISINSYLSIQTTKRLSEIKTYPSSPHTSFTGKIIYLYNKKVIIKTKNGYSLTGFLPKHHTNTLGLDDIIHITGHYTQPSLASNPGQYNNLKYAIHHKKLGHIYIKSLKIIKKQSLFSLNKASYVLKKHIKNQHTKSMKNPHATIYSALIFGENYSELDYASKQRFKKAGLIHAIVVSGSQVSLILGLCHIVLNWLGIVRHYQLYYLIPISIFFYILTGGGASVLRAILMAHILFILKFGFGYRSSPLHVISMTGLIMIILDPFVIYKTGAILSFLATFSLVFGSELVKKQLPHSLPIPLKEILSIGIAPWLFTTPILIIKFQSLPLGSLISNIILIQLIEYTVIIGFTATLIGMIFFPLAYLLHQLSWISIEIIIIISNWVIKIPLSEIPISQHNMVTVLFVIASWICFKTTLSFKTKCYSCTCLILIGINSYYFHYKNTVIITQLNIGQGDATIIKTNHLSCLIDTGPPYDKYLGSIPHSVLFPALRYYGIRTLDLLILTHFDQDHVGNLSSLLETIPIKTIIHNGNLMTYLKKHNITLPKDTLTQSLCHNDQLIYHDLNITFLNNCNNHPSISKNNQSLIFKVSKAPYSMLFTGDIEEKTEYSLLKNNSHNLKSTLLKVGHHGSKTSSSKIFLKAINPAHSIISAGKNNRYNHPHPSVISRLKHYGKIWRTDQAGAIIIKLTKTLSIQSFLN
ncbi:DNA internalization-related competence protein ComEC/Rec2 [bacterium]|nr:DNA internalization-related competence protein ComEC/Rec2 [bacterium]